MNKETMQQYKPSDLKLSEMLNIRTSFLRKDNRKNKTGIPEVLFVTSFPPRECGIATYTEDLINNLKNQFSESFQCSVCALESDTEKPQYIAKPKYIINTDQELSYVRAAAQINSDPYIKLVVIQHEFGLFEKQEIGFKFFIEQLSKPIQIVFHTVIPNPNAAWSAKVRNLASKASSIIVMIKNSAKILKDAYNLDEKKIAVIPHGTHLAPKIDVKSLKKKHQLESKKVLSTFGLLGPGKSIETTLDALPEIIKTHPDVLFLILGKTHPSIVKQFGEQYREMLTNKIKDLQLENHVRFVNAYLPLPDLLEYLQLSDIYLFTSKDPNQAVSGTFSYAISSGCPVISTPIPHAVEVLNDGNGILFDFESSKQLAKAAIELLDNNKLRSEITIRSFQKMANTAWQNSAIKHALLFKKISDDSIQIQFGIPEINLNHIHRLTTDFGMIQFSKLSSPDILSGYTLDDNARALIATCKHYHAFGDENDLSYIHTYFEFIQFCFQENQTFLNYVSEKKQFTAQNIGENLEDSTGRAIWALGTVVSMNDILPEKLCHQANEILQNALLHLEEIHSTRAMAFIIKGIYKQDNENTQFLLKVLAGRIVQMYKHEKTDNWNWFESYMTYGNSVLPEAMLSAYLSTNRTEYKAIAKESFDFLLSKIFIDGKLKPISNKGWHVRGRSENATIGGEQPIDVAYTIMALEQFYAVFKDESYKEKANVAFAWFLGLNHLNQIVYNPITGGSYDGVEEYNVNLNQGAESTVSYLLARLSIEKIKTSKSQDSEDSSSSLALFEACKEM